MPAAQDSGYLDLVSQWITRWAFETKDTELYSQCGHWYWGKGAFS